jgi:hypothetical protein
MKAQIVKKAWPSTGVRTHKKTFRHKGFKMAEVSYQGQFYCLDSNPTKISMPYPVKGRFST